jgi:hypothetical protein
MQRKFLRAGNLGRNPPLDFEVYGEHYTIAK